MPKLTEQERDFLDRVFGPAGTVQAKNKKPFKTLDLSARVKKIMDMSKDMGVIDGESQIFKLLRPYLERAKELAKPHPEASFRYLEAIEASLKPIKKDVADIARIAHVATQHADIAFHALLECSNNIGMVLDDIHSEIEAVIQEYHSPRPSDIRAHYKPPFSLEGVQAAHAYSKAEYQRLNAALETARSKQALIVGLTPHLKQANDALTAFRQVLTEIDDYALKATTEQAKAMFRTSRLVAERRLRSLEVNRILVPSGQSVKSSRDLLGDAQVQLDGFIARVLRDLAGLDGTDDVKLRIDRVAAGEDTLAIAESQKAHRRDMTYLADKTRELGKLMRSQASDPTAVEPAASLNMTALVFEGGPLNHRSARAGEEARLRMETKHQQSSEQERADLVFDFLVTSEEVRKQKLCDVKGWNPQTLTPKQERWIKSVLNGISAALDSAQAGRLSEDGATLQLGEHTLHKEAEPVGKGGFGEVFKLVPQGNAGPALALKVMNASANLPPDPREARSQLQEGRIAIEKELRVHHHLMRGDRNAIGRQHIISLEGVVKDAQGNLNMVMELADGGDLNKNMEAMTYASSAGVLSKETQDILNARQMQQLLEGMIYLRNMGVTHFDMKPANVFMTADGTLKIGDFGSGGIGLKSGGGQVAMGDGTAGFSAPGGGDVDKGDSSFDTHALARIMEMMSHNKVQVRSGFDGESRSVGVLDELLSAMSNPVSTLRPSLEQVLESSYFANAMLVPAQELEQLQRLTTQYGQALNAFVKRNLDEILEKLGSAIGPSERAAIASKALSFTQAMAFSTEQWTTFAQAVGAAIDELESLADSEVEGLGGTFEEHFSELSNDALSNVDRAGRPIDQKVPQSASELLKAREDAAEALKKLRDIRLDIANQDEIALIGEQLKAVQDRIAQATA